MKSILSFLLALVCSSVFAQTYVDKATLDTITVGTKSQTVTVKVPIQSTKDTVIKIPTVSYKDSSYAITIPTISVKKYNPVTPPPPPPPPTQTIALSFVSLTTEYIRPGAGPEQWHNGSARISYPDESQPLQVENSLDVYYRFHWDKLEGSTQGSYTWGYFDGLIQSAINKGQKFSFGIMTFNGDGGGVSYGGGTSAYPLYLHNLMQSESNKDWLNGSGIWIPNFNSQHYIGRLRALHQAVRDHLLNTRYTATSGPNQGKSILLADAVYCIDVRGFGNWGEWHTYDMVDNWSSFPAGRQPTIATLKAIIDTHTQVFDRWPLVMMVAAYDGGQTGIPIFAPYPEVAFYALTARNAWGGVGFRRDQWGATDAYLNGLLEGNNRTFNGSVPFKNIILEKYKNAPITGEPYPGSLDMSDLLRQVNLYHPTSIGNGNYGAYPSNITVRNRIRDAFKKCGYRLEPKGGNVSLSSGQLSITINWQNVGISPTYEDWNVVFELVYPSGGIAWSSSSSFKPKLFLPQASPTPITDNFPVNLPSGIYTLRMIVKENSGYRQPMPLQITGRQANGSYNLTNITF